MEIQFKIKKIQIFANMLVDYKKKKGKNRKYNSTENKNQFKSFLIC